ncbi:hypothetical protein ACFYYH_13475 [Streptomyces sp. NPDC002018]|uniref:hypothetical protein n=1 Tax=Streptomyces sp. NPDC002018 TaxID=3364629 RepID=UPI003689E140
MRPEPGVAQPRRTVGVRPPWITSPARRIPDSLSEIRSRGSGAYSATSDSRVFSKPAGSPAWS